MEKLQGMAEHWEKFLCDQVSPRPMDGCAVDKRGRVFAIGRRKASSAQVWISQGDGKVTVNGRSLCDYFKTWHGRQRVLEAFWETDTIGAFDVTAVVIGGGTSGQADAIKLGVARALQQWDPDFRPILKRAGHLTRDARVKEEKKPGLKKARKAKAWVKR